MKLGFKLYFEDRTVCVPLSSLVENVRGDRTEYIYDENGIRVTWGFEKAGTGRIITLDADSDQPLGIRRIDSLCFEADCYGETDRVLFFSNNMMVSEHRYPCELCDGTERAADCTGLYKSLAGEGFALAMISPFKNIYGAGAVKSGEMLSFFAKTEFCDGMLSSTHLSAERVFFAEDITIDNLYSEYRGFLPTSSFPMPKLVGWNTWDYYLNRVTPEDIFENIEALEKMPFAGKLNYIVIDDGWQKEWGVWKENEKFSCGLDTVAKRISEKGFLAGIWMAPLLMKNSCEGFDSRMHWFCKTESGEYLRSEGGTYVIDPTLPEAESFILDNYRYLYSCGYRLFKIDYLSTLTKVKDFYDKTATPYSALSRLMERIQQATGEDAVILGCSLPVQCGADIAPSMRIGVDIHNHFTHAKWIAESLSWTWMYNNVTTRIDPDFLVVRGTDTSNEPLVWEGAPNYTAPKRRSDMSDTDFCRSRWRQGDQFNFAEAETWSYLVAFSGGNIFLSDRMSVLNERGVSLIADAMEAECEECRPIYLDSDSRLPSMWTSNGKLLLINWEDEPRRIEVGCDAGEVISSKKFELSEGRLSVVLKPHESFFAKIK